MLTSGVLGRLSEIVGSGNVLAEADPVAEAVAKPASTDEVQRIVALARDEGLALTPRGGGTGLWGGAVPLRGGIVLSTERLVGEPELHREDLYVVVGAGAVTGRVREGLRELGLFYPVDPASEATSTIGGNVGEGASGLRSLKYGTTRNYVLGLEVVTGEAKVVRLGAKTVKNVAGYDLTRLMVGSEGTLGIVTSVTLKMLLAPPDEVVLVFPLADIRLAAEAAAELMTLGVAPVLVDVVDRESTRELGGVFASGAGAFLLVGFDGPRSLCDEEASKIKVMMKTKYGAAPAVVSWRPESESILGLRRRVLPGLIKSYGSAVIEDLSLRPASMPRMVEKVSEVSRETGTRMAVWGHAGWGLIHVALPAKAGEPGGREEVSSILAQVADECRRLGGSAYGEVDIGGGKLPPPRLATSGAGLDVLAKLKQALDPKGIMNPGKMGYGA